MVDFRISYGYIDYVRYTCTKGSYCISVVSRDGHLSTIRMRVRMSVRAYLVMRVSDISGDSSMIVHV